MSRKAKGRPWRDPKRYLWPLGLIAPAGPFIGWLLANNVSGVLWGFGGYLVLVIVPIVDVVWGADHENPPEDATMALSADRYYRWCTYLFIPVQYAGLAFGFWCLAQDWMTTGERVGLSITMGMSAAIGINAAHELGHKRSRLERALAKFALAPSAYGHFYIEHNVGHHVRVATPEDPASARFGESLWAFYPRAVAGSVASGVRSEAVRLQRQGRRFFSPHNGILQVWGLSLAMVAVVVGVFGWRMLPWIAVQALVGIMLLEAVNYIEHYGLLRAEGPDGRPVRVAAEHSWNCDFPGGNLLLLNLQRHSDHHANAGRRYQVLRSCADAPQLPAGYTAMVLAALVPPIWYRVMNPRVLAHYGGDLSRANLQQSKRRRLERRYGRPAAVQPPKAAAATAVTPTSSE